jgi:hypothetical protein
MLEVGIGWFLNRPLRHLYNGVVWPGWRKACAPSAKLHAGNMWRSKSSGGAPSKATLIGQSQSYASHMGHKSYWVASGYLPFISIILSGTAIYLSVEESKGAGLMATAKGIHRFLRYIFNKSILGLSLNSLILAH